MVPNPIIEQTIARFAQDNGFTTLPRSIGILAGIEGCRVFQLGPGFVDALADDSNMGDSLITCLQGIGLRTFRFHSRFDSIIVID
jgi:hypothetical protein